MNTTPRSPIVTNTRGHPSEFGQIITEKSENFVGREFVFAAINEFLHKYTHGYFTLRGAPGSGKTAILAKYVTSNPHVIYYSAQVEGKNQADEFLITICNQLMGMGNGESGMGNGDLVLPDNATEGSWFLSLLLQKISDNLEFNQRLIIAIDALDAIDPHSQSASSNLFYLPRYLPHKVYFLLTRRPFVRERSRLLIEAPSQILDLKDYPEQNRADVQTYIRNYLTPPAPLPYKGRGEQNEQNSFSITPLSKEEKGESDSPLLAGEGLGERSNLKSWLITHNISEQELSDRLTTQTENNFMYLSEILPAISQGFYTEPFHFDILPPALEAYYQSHWQRMKGKALSAVELAVLNILVYQEQPISAETITQIIDEDEYEVEEVLENWIEFLQQPPIDGEIHYSLYHSSFRDWLGRQLNLDKLRRI